MNSPSQVSAKPHESSGSGVITHPCRSWPFSAGELYLPAWLRLRTQGQHFRPVRVIKMGSVVPMATLTSVLPAWRPLATARLAFWGLTPGPPCLPWPGSPYQTSRKHPPCPSHRGPVLSCCRFMHVTLDSQDNSPGRQEGETEAKRGSRTCSRTVGTKVCKVLYLQDTKL